MIARFLGVRVWELSKVAVHYQDEAAVILMSQNEAKRHLTGKGASGMAGGETVLIREF